ncbi:MAG TPA: DNA-binding protein, partial [Alphaproteobacteria bacterium]|nr:DNA-binding protein [Alphaproteobacteria bacterium]
LRQRARTALQTGHSVIADAVHARPEERRALEAVATEQAARFDGLWLDAPEPVLTARVDARRGDASDADARVVRQQRNYRLGEIGWHKISAAGTPEDTHARARHALAHIDRQ